jgi:23S rRNA (adenine2503-C2)-methyltransferase
MQILNHLSVPTGDILVVQGSKGKLEMLSIADYGQDVNLNQHKPVPNDLPLMPLTEKWVITISTQYSCKMICKFCDVPKVRAESRDINATLEDLQGQILTGLSLHPEIKSTKRLNVHFARMGEPSWNPAVLDCGRWLKEDLDGSFHIHPVVSTMMPRKNWGLGEFIREWMDIKNNIYNGNAGLQLSINSTSEEEREYMFSNNACSLHEIGQVMDGIKPKGRKITLNFAIAGYTVDPAVLLKYFSPDHYICKLTPMHKTNTAIRHGIETTGDYTSPEPYLEIEANLQKAGYETLVFIASEDEDLGRITCGNAILSGSLPHKFSVIR